MLSSKKVLFLFIFVFNLFTVFSFTVSIYPSIEDNTFNYICSNASGYNFSSGVVSSSSFSCSDFSKAVVIYPIKKDSKYFGTSISSDGTFEIRGNYSEFLINDEENCKITSVSFNNFKSNISSNLDPGAPFLNTFKAKLPEVLTDGYYMKTFVVLKATEGSDVKYFHPDSTNGRYTYNNNNGNYNQLPGSTDVQLSSYFGTSWNTIQSNLGLSSTQVPYILLKDTQTQVQFTDAQTQLNDLCAETQTFCNPILEVIAIPIDGKCDFNDDGKLDDEFIVGKSSKVPTSQPKIQVNLTNFNGSAEYSISSTTQISLPENTVSTIFLPNSYGIILQYTADQGNVITKVEGCNEANSRKEYQKEFERKGTCTISSPSSSLPTITLETQPRDADNDNIPFYADLCPNMPGEVIYAGCPLSTIITNHTSQENISSITRTFSESENENCQKYFSSTPKIDINSVHSRNKGVDELFYKYHTYNQTSDYSGFTFCINISEIYHVNRISKKINYPNYKLYDEYRNFEFKKLENGELVYVPYIFSMIKQDSLGIEKETRKIWYEHKNGTFEDVNVSSVTKTIQKIKNGNQRNKRIDETDIALEIPKIKKITSKQEIESLLETSINLFKTITISENITSIVSGNDLDKTKITLSLTNVPTSQNITLYYILPKETVLSAKDIVLASSSGTYFVFEKDPIIGWHFEGSDGDEEIVIEVPNDSDGGAIVLSNDPVVYNNGDLIVNYREDQCRSDEQELFQLDNLRDSNVYPKQSGKFYKVCVAHLEYDLSETGSNTLFIFNITSNNLSSLQDPGTSIELSVDNSEFWDLQIQEQALPGYSCLGSLNTSTGPSLVGDCDYNPQKRIWVALNKDNTPPTIQIETPYLSSTAEMQILVTDSQSGVNWATAKYCTSETESCTPDTPFTENQRILLQCSNSYTGCLKYINVEIFDNQNNKATHAQTIRLLEKGSSCQADCTAKPSPNRYLKECNLLNGCFYYQYDATGTNDNGEYVSNLCDLNIQGTWVKYNDTHEIQCPRGPFRLSAFTNQDLEITSSPLCSGILTDSYPVIYNGQLITLKIATCL
jgi:hypothetical protein